MITRHKRSKGKVKVTFELPHDVEARTVVLCGEFTDWTAEPVPLVCSNGGAWQATVALEAGRSYRYRYLLDGERWENDSAADDYVANPYGGDDSVVRV